MKLTKSDTKSAIMAKSAEELCAVLSSLENKSEWDGEKALSEYSADVFAYLGKLSYSQILMGVGKQLSLGVSEDGGIECSLV